MADFVAPLQELVDQFRRLPGIGGKTAVRLAFSVMEFTDEEAAAFASAILHAKQDIHLCSSCCNISTESLCDICADDGRDRSVICVVEDAKAVLAMERVHDYRGTYHVLGGVLSPMNGIGPERLHIRELLSRLSDDSVQEVIVATNPTVEGEATAMYISRLLKPMNITVSRLAYGIPVGGDLEYADEVTLHRALEGRRPI
ncbi:MAG: recombination protein RecR [Clostridia bacterium]|nr:recombination protein RecR [Clostridia bacterium]